MTRIAAVTLAAFIAGCSSATVTWSVKPSAAGGSTPARIFVAPAAVDIGAATGNVAVNFTDVQRTVTDRLLSIVREVDPSARVADTSIDSPFQPMARYIEAVAPSRATRDEIDAAGYALRQGGTGLLVPTIVEWRQTRTDDPVGALTVPHDRVVIALRFVHLDPVALSGRVTFENHGKLTLNARADRLLNGDFRKTVLELLAPPTQPASPQPAGARQERLNASVARVYDPGVLHRIEIVIAPEDARAIANRSSERTRCTFTFDGIVLKDVGVRQAGGTFNRFVAIDEKPTLSVKFDDFIDGQELHGLEKMVLKDGRQDSGFVGEHLTYEVYRRAGIAAPMTAHAHVTINGKDSGIYVMREPINRDFLTRNFGRDLSRGNLYELNYQPDPMLGPNQIRLKDEVEQQRTRTELLGAADAVTNASPDTFVAAVSRYVDLDRYITYYAVEAVTSNYDGFSFNVNNAYLYTHPRDGRLIMIPYGADSSFWAEARITKIRGPSQTPRAALARRVQSIPELAQKFAAEVARVGREPVWDKKVLHDRLAQVDRILATAPATGRSAADVKRFVSYRPVIEAFIDASGTTNGSAGLP